jgi:translation initiation factor 2B subunit (eIF-2B alpha/beta/delta family)
MKEIEQRLATVCNDRDHGSRWIVREAVSIMYDLASDTTSSSGETMQHLHLTAQKLVQAHPAMAALAGAVRRLEEIAGGPTEIATVASGLLQEIDHATEHITTYARPMLRGTLMTHSMSGTVLDVIVDCKAQIEQVIVLEGRPRYEGRNMAQLLAEQGGFAVTLITDAQADIFLPQCQAIVVGADTVFANGDVINKAGTALLAWAAQGHNVPLYVLCETLKFSPLSWVGDLERLEEKDAEEVMDQPIKGIKVRNFYFDRTSSHLITSLLTDRGIISPGEVKQMVSLL